MDSKNNSPQSPEVQVYKHPNLEIRSFLTQKDISSYRVEYFKRTSLDQAEDTLKTLGTIGERAVREIMALPGVEGIHIKPRELRIRKQIFSSWDVLEPKIIEILKRAIRKKQIVRIK